MATTGIRSEPPLVVIVGPTASGKTGLATRLAKEFGGEIISADSRAIYKGLDIGTAKPDMLEREGVPHWGIDIVDPSERFTVADFKDYAVQKIAEIRLRGHVPFLVGGTGLYIDAVVYDYQFPDGTNDVSRRDMLANLSLGQLHEYCEKNNIHLPENYKNKRYVINAILRQGHSAKRQKRPDPNTIIVGITTEKVELRKRIEQRASDIFAADIVGEAQQAAKSYGWDSSAMTGNVYPLVRQYLMGEMTIDEAQDRFVLLDWHLAKRQLTWLRRSEHIHWFELDEAYTYCARKLAKLNIS